MSRSALLNWWYVFASYVLLSSSLGLHNSIFYITHSVLVYKLFFEFLLINRRRRNLVVNHQLPMVKYWGPIVSTNGRALAWRSKFQIKVTIKLPRVDSWGIITNHQPPLLRVESCWPITKRQLFSSWSTSWWPITKCQLTLLSQAWMVVSRFSS